MKTLLQSIKELLLEVFGGVSPVELNQLNHKLDAVLATQDLVLANQSSLAIYLGLQDGVGATPEELTSLGARIKSAKDQLRAFDAQTNLQTNP